MAYLRPKLIFIAFSMKSRRRHDISSSVEDSCGDFAGMLAFFPLLSLITGWSQYFRPPLALIYTVDKSLYESIYTWLI